MVALSGWGAIVRPAAAALWLLVALAWSDPARAETLLRLGLPVSLDSPASLKILEFARQDQARTINAINIELRGKERHLEEQEVLAEVASGNLEIRATTRRVSTAVRARGQAGYPGMANPARIHVGYRGLEADTLAWLGEV